MNFRADMFLQHWNTDFNRQVQNDNMLLRNTALMIDGMWFLIWRQTFIISAMNARVSSANEKLENILNWDLKDVNIMKNWDKDNVWPRPIRRLGCRIMGMSVVYLI